MAEFQRRIRFLYGLLMAFTFSPQLSAQWLTESFDIPGGWSAIYTHVDASHVTLDELIGGNPNNPITEVWLWQPDLSTAQFITSPQEPVDTGTQWAVWRRDSDPESNTLNYLFGDQAYLIRIQPNSADPYLWQVQGKPSPPNYRWTVSGMNFIGFSTPTLVPPDFDAFFSESPEFRDIVEVFRYVGGRLRNNNPRPINNLRSRNVLRGKAYWVRAGDLYNRYFGPIELSLQDSDGLEFGDSGGQYRIRAKNLAAQEVTMSFSLLGSELAPAGQAPVVGLPPILVRGDLDPATLTYNHTDLNAAAHQWTLAPIGELGSEVEIILGLDRASMVGNVGDLFAGILQVTDSLGFQEVNLPVSATVTSGAGLWVGEAMVDQVRHQLVSYQRDENGNLVQDENGKYIPETTDNTLGSVARAFPLRLILHQDAGGAVRLLQRVYIGLDTNSETILTLQESALDPAQLAEARRVSVVHLPWTEQNLGWSGAGAFAQGQTLTVQVPLAYDAQESNPFLHTYHPDHDNLNPQFDAILPVGSESFNVTRAISLTFNIPPDDFASRTNGSLLAGGNYSETITFGGAGTETREYASAGTFALNRVSKIDTLTTP